MHAMKLFAKSERVRKLKETRLKNMKLLVPFTRDRTQDGTVWDTWTIYMFLEKYLQKLVSIFI